LGPNNNLSRGLTSRRLARNGPSSGRNPRYNLPRGETARRDSVTRPLTHPRAALTKVTRALSLRSALCGGPGLTSNRFRVEEEKSIGHTIARPACRGWTAGNGPPSAGLLIRHWDSPVRAGLRRHSPADRLYSLSLGRRETPTHLSPRPAFCGADAEAPPGAPTSTIKDRSRDCRLEAPTCDCQARCRRSRRRRGRLKPSVMRARTSNACPETANGAPTLE
jgi:hypothetical protein